MTSDLVPSSAIPDYPAKDLAVIRNTIMPKNSSDQEFLLFLAFCHNLGFHPMLKHVFPLKFGDQLNFKISIDGHLLIAHRSGVFKGFTTPVITARSKDGTVRACEPWLFDPGQDQLVSVTVGLIHSEDPEPYRVTCYLNEYFVPSNPRWKTSPVQMLTKCGITRAIRERIPADWGGAVGFEEAESVFATIAEEQTTATPKGKSRAIVNTETHIALPEKPIIDITPEPEEKYSGVWDRCVAWLTKMKVPQEGIDLATTTFKKALDFRDIVDAKHIPEKHEVALKEYISEAVIPELQTHKFLSVNLRADQ